MTSIKTVGYLRGLDMPENYYMGGTVDEGGYVEGYQGYVEVEEWHDIDGAYIWMLSVLDEHQRKGVGRRLMERVCADADKAGISVQLHATRMEGDGDEKIEWLVKFYESFGFEIVAIEMNEREFYIGDQDEDAPDFDDYGSYEVPDYIDRVHMIRSSK